MEKIVDQLIIKGEELYNSPFSTIQFSKDEEVNRVMNDIDNYPHIFVLSCVMDRQINAERAWRIPVVVSKIINDLSFNGFFKLTEEEILRIFVENSLHRFNEVMSQFFYKAIKKIHLDYKNDASLIWKGNLKSATIVRRFIQFEGVGVKIATMATNILAREFKIKIQDRFCIDISPDVHVKRVFTRLGLIDINSSNEELIYCARELNPEYPGVFDLSLWEIGRNWCRPKNPLCNDCYLNDGCLKKINENL